MCAYMHKCVHICTYARIYKCFTIRSGVGGWGVCAVCGEVGAGLITVRVVFSKKRALMASKKSPFLRLVILWNHKLIIAKAKADCDSSRSERRSPAERRPHAGRAPSAGRRRLGYFPKTVFLFSKAESDIFQYLMSH